MGINDLWLRVEKATRDRRQAKLHFKHPPGGPLLIRRLGSQVERNFIADAELQGYRVLHVGWPDFLIWKESAGRPIETRMIEVKGPGDKLSAEQEWMHHVLLEAFGIQVEISSGKLARTHK